MHRRQYVSANLLPFPFPFPFPSPKIFLPCAIKNEMLISFTVTWSAAIIHWLTSTKDDLGAGPARTATVVAQGEGEYHEMR